MKENPKQKQRRAPSAPKERQHSRSDRLDSESNEEAYAPRYPDLPNDIVDKVLAELREKENAAHE